MTHVALHRLIHNSTQICLDHLAFHPPVQVAEVSSLADELYEHLAAVVEEEEPVTPPEAALHGELQSSPPLPPPEIAALELRAAEICRAEEERGRQQAEEDAEGAAEAARTRAYVASLLGLDVGVAVVTAAAADASPSAEGSGAADTRSYVQQLLSQMEREGPPAVSGDGEASRG